jgi:hypothetical protein
VKPKRPKPSTTATPTEGYFTSCHPVLTLSTGPATIGTALLAHAVLHANVPFSLLAGILCLVLLRSQAVIAVLFALFGVVLVPVGMIHVILARKDPAEYFLKVLTRITNLAISFQVLVPAQESPAENDTGRASLVSPEQGPSLDPLPPAVNTARMVNEDIYWATIQVMAERRPDGLPDIVPGLSCSTQPAKGRHAKLESEVDAAAENLVNA